MRAFFAFFAAARAAGWAGGHDVGKTHKGVLNAFSNHLIKAGPLPKELGRLLKLAETRRYVADYAGDTVTLADAREMIGQATTFVEALRARLSAGG